MTEQVAEAQDAADEQLLPETWVWTTLGEVADTTTRRTSPQERPGLPFIGMEHVEAHTMRLLGSSPAEEMKSNAEHFEADDVLYGRLRPYLNKVYRPKFEGLCSAEFIVFRKQSHLNSRFLQYYLNSWEFVSYASHLNTGDRPRVNADQLASYRFPLAPLAEQRRIVAAIEEQFTRLDAAVASLKRAQANLRRYRAAVLKAACEGKLVPQDPSDEPASVLLERILAERRARWEAGMRAKGKDPRKARYEEPRVPETEGLPELPEGWCWAGLEQVSWAVRYGTSAKTSADQGGVPILRMGNIQDGTLELSNLKYLPVDHSEFPELFLEAGDLLFNRTNSSELVGKSAVYMGQPSPCSYASYLISVRLLPGCLPKYLCFFLNSWYGRLWVASVVSQQVGQANVNGTKLQALIFPLPPLTEQHRIVAEVEQRISIVEQVEATIKSGLERADRLRQAILARAFAGHLVPQDPDDEPASVLLERIRASRQPSMVAGRSRSVRQLSLPARAAP